MNNTNTTISAHVAKSLLGYRPAGSSFLAPQDQKARYWDDSFEYVPKLVSAQVLNSLLDDPASSSFPAPKPVHLHTRHKLQPKGHDYAYVVDTGDRSGILIRETGEFQLRGVGKRKPITTGFSRKGVVDWFVEPSRKRGIIRMEWAVLPNDKGASQAMVDTLVSAGYIVLVTNTNNTPKGRAQFCDLGCEKKNNSCDGCTRRDLLSLAALTNDYFYEPHPNRFHVGSKNQSGSMGAIVNSELNDLRFFHPPYAPIMGDLPTGLLEAFSGDVAPSALVHVCSRLTVAAERGYKVYRRLIGDHVNSRRGQPGSTIRKNDWDVRQLRDIGKAYFRWLKAKAAQTGAQVRYSLLGNDPACSIFPAPLIQ